MWHWSALWREAWLNVVRRTVLTMGALHIAALVGVALAVFTLGEWSRLDTDLARLTQAGRNVVVVQTLRPEDEEFALSRRSCEQVLARPDVLAAGGRVFLGEDFVSQFGSRVPVYGVSRTLIDFGDGNAVIGATLASTAGLRADGRIASRSFGLLDARIGATVPTGLDLDAALAVPLDASRTWVPECIVWLTPFASATERLPLIQAGLVTRNGLPLSTLTVQSPLDAAIEFSGRSTRHVIPIAGLVLGLTSALLRRVRGSEIAAYRMSGTTRLGMLLLVVTEEAIVAATFVASFAIAIGAIGLEPQRALAALFAAWAGASAWLAAFGLAVTPTILTSPITLAKDR